MWVDLALALGISPFMFRPLVLLLALGLVSGLVGVIVNLRSLEFNAEAMVHSIFPGIVAGAVFGGIDMIIPAASALALVVAVILAVVSRSRLSEPGVAVVLTSFFSLGVVLSLKKGDQSGQLEALMFGRLLEVTDSPTQQRADGVRRSARGDRGDVASASLCCLRPRRGGRQRNQLVGH